VEDQGIGIPELSQGKLFEAFTQADASTSRRYGGSGLGLSICKHLVEKMGGKIGLASEEGKGSTFWFTLRLREGNERKILKKDSVKQEVLPPELCNMRVLVAEDNTINQKIAVKMLEKMGLKADVVGTGGEALDALRSLPYALVVMDCQMPEMDGFEATRIIRSSQTLNLQAIPVVAMTANALKGDREKCIEAGMSDYLSKPVTYPDLLIVMKKWLSEAKAG
jgi:CheY-like chemotaxis protein